MVFKVGETVVYPHHGAALIEKMKTRTIKGEDKIYLVLKVAQGDLTIEVPAENCDLVGVRDVSGPGGLERVFEVPRAPASVSPLAQPKVEIRIAAAINCAPPEWKIC